jgi:hypothetical protein
MREYWVCRSVSSGKLVASVTDGRPECFSTEKYGILNQETVRDCFREDESEEDPGFMQTWISRGSIYLKCFPSEFCFVLMQFFLTFLRILISPSCSDWLIQLILVISPCYCQHTFFTLYHDKMWEDLPKACQSSSKVGNMADRY